MAYKLSVSAEQDVISIYLDGCVQFGQSQAEAYHADLEKTFELLAEFPGLSRERVELTPPVRIHPCGSHVIIYTVDDAGDVLVIRVRHGREDWLKHPVEEP